MRKVLSAVPLWRARRARAAYTARARIDVPAFDQTRGIPSGIPSPQLVTQFAELRDINPPNLSLIYTEEKKSVLKRESAHILRSRTAPQLSRACTSRPDRVHTATSPRVTTCVESRGVSRCISADSLTSVAVGDEFGPHR